MEITTPAYQLPYPATEFEALLILANNANKLSITAESHAQMSIMLYDEVYDKILPQLADDKTLIFQSVKTAGQTMISTAESALLARRSELEILQSISQKAHTTLTFQQEKIVSIKNQLEELENQAANLRARINQSTDQALLNKIPSDDSNKLLTLLETIGIQQNLLQSIADLQKLTQANIDYFGSAINAIKERINKIEEQSLANGERINRLEQSFGINELSNEETITQTPITPPVTQPIVSSDEDMAKDEQEEEPAKKKKRRKSGSLIWSYIKIILIALVIAFAVRFFVIDITHVEGLSMYPTLNDSDNLLNAKALYLFTEPERGDIVVFDAPDAPGEDYVKRIIGLPNEEITISRGMVYIDGKLLNEPYLVSSYTEGEIRTEIPEGFYFVMGDNRDISRDSRTDDVGLISFDQINGKSILRIYPFESFGIIE